MDGGGGRGPRMKMREAGFVPTVGVLQAFQSGYWVCAKLDIFVLLCGRFEKNLIPPTSAPPTDPYIRGRGQGGIASGK